MTIKRPVAAIAAIGTELTLGQSSESNSEYLGRWLGQMGYPVRIVLKLPDDAGLVTEELRHIVHSADLILITGGLGATHDDITRDALAALLEKPLLPNSSLKARIGRMAPPGADYKSFIKQAYLPKGAGFLEATAGTAPGIVAEYNDKVIYALPGVPSEMKAMLEEVAQDLTGRFGRQPGIVVKGLKIIGVSEPVVAGQIDPVIKRYPQLTVNILAKLGEIKLTVMGEEGLEVVIDQAVGELADRLGGAAYGGDQDTISSVVGRLLVERRMKIAVAESLTAGLIASQIAETAGSSHYLIGGIVAYDNAAKESLLSVSHETIANKGAVSYEVASAMAEGVRSALRTDLGLSVTGIAGPGGGSPDKPVGLVFVGLAHQKGTEVKELALKGDRRSIQRKTAAAALNVLRLFLLKESAG
ncbi:MAG: CinA family nicotinamide mononucleotide deamidase-related protein [Actinomycetota bacterium]|nr:CinA family nicotinamide mononucleotide deamidase-related protein [Actinomycetota bacterium]